MKIYKPNNIGTSDILKMFTNISRDFLYYLEDKGVISPAKVQAGVKRNGSSRAYRERVYSEEDLRRLFLAVEAHQQGLKAEKIVDTVLDPAKLINQSAVTLSRDILHVVQDLCSGAAPTAVWKILADMARMHLGCESVSVFLAPLGDSARFELAASSGPSPDREPPSAWSDTTGSDRHINLTVEAIDSDPFATGLRAHLAARRCFSLLALAVRRRRGASLLRGWIVAENRVDRKGIASPGCFFDPAIEATGDVVASLASLIVDLLPQFALRRSLLSAMEQHQSLEVFLEEVLKQAVAATGADRGDVAWWDANSERAQIAALFGNSVKSRRDLISNHSVMRRVFETGQAKVIPDVLEDPDYDECDPKTRSELCVPVLRPRKERPIAVINVESHEIGFFDRLDLRVLEELAEYAALYGHMLETYDVITSVIPVGEPTTDAEVRSATHRSLTTLLEHVAQEQELDKGLIFVADYRGARLCCVAAHPINGRETDALSYALSDASLVTKVFHEGIPRFVAKLDDELDVSRRDMKETFACAGSVIVMPLLFGPSVIGVIAVWSTRPGLPTRAHLDRLRPYADLAVTSIAVASELQRHKQVLESIRVVMTRMATENRQTVLREILEALIKTDFDRARLFELTDDCAMFRCLDSTSRIAEERSYRGETIDVRTSPYAELTIKLRPDEWHAVIQKPKPDHPDPNAVKLGKPLLMPWAVAPLFVGGVLYGYLACDNAHQNKEITEQDLQLLDVFASLAAQAVAAGRSEGR